MDSIFVSIASYMDNELENTINDLLKKSENPQNITIGVCIQDTLEELDRYKLLYFNETNIKIIYINHLESKGCCWARSKIQCELFQNEKYYFQLDAHHRFIEKWDTLCKQMIHNCVDTYSNNKIILSSYAVPCNLKSGVMNITHQDKPYKMKCEKFYNTKKVRYIPEAINIDVINEPILSYTISAHLLFTFGTWLSDVPYDPNLYFDGEEDSLAIRSFTNGWDIFCPHKIICYHYYIRNGAKRHSDFDKEWYKLNDLSLQRFNKLIKNELKDKYSLGTVKTMYDYISASGIDYNNSVINDFNSKVHKLKFSQLPNTKLEIVDRLHCEVLLDFGDVYFCKKGKKWNEKKSNNKNHWCHFEEICETDIYFELFDSGRHVYLKLYKNLSEILVKTDAEYTTMYKSEISCIENIETESSVCVFNYGKVNENNKNYCKKNNYNYICYDTEFDVENTFESMSILYNVMCFVNNDILFAKQFKLENLPKQNIKCDSNIYVRCNDSEYIQKNNILCENKFNKSSLFIKTSNEQMIKKINQQFK